MDELHLLVRQVAEALGKRSYLLATAESCTGGWVAKLATDLPGSSHWFERGFVTYTNASKQEMLGVPKAVLERHGAVSEPVVCSMAQGALERSHAQIALSISGIAGPGGGSEEKPVGTVWMAWASKGGGLSSKQYHFSGDREDVRRQAVQAALQGVIDVLQST